MKFGPKVSETDAKGLAEQSHDRTQLAPCTFCGEDRFSFVREGRDLSRPEYQERFALVRCLSCGLILQNPLPHKEELSKAYSGTYAPYRPAWKEDGWPWWKVFRVLTTRRRLNRLRRYAKGEKLLEIGCGAGDFLYAAHCQGWQVRAVEYNDDVAGKLRADLGLDVPTGELKPGLWGREEFDVVILWSVLEHVPDPLDTLVTVSSYLKTGGVALLQIPTADGVQLGRHFGQYWALLDLPRHLNFFSKRILSRLCDKSNMDLVLFRTPLLDIAWCYCASSSNYMSGPHSRIAKFVRLPLLLAATVLIVPALLVRAWNGCGTEAFAVAIKR